ncbi:MAG TPA: glycosyltransferase family 4 protein [Candidatus Acidoferrales bacterium]|nr:glycosyltransferase family 4 protein [Candidatus Acidoferrales bacterium]
MRIAYLHYLYDEPSGLLHVHQFAEAARQLGHDVRVHAMNLAPHDGIGMGTPDASRRWLKQHLSRYLHEPKELLWNPRYIARELAIVREERPDVLLVREHHLTFAEIVVRRLTQLPLVLEVNAPADESSAYFDEYAHLPAVGRLTERLKLRGADRIVVVSEALRRFLAEGHDLPLDRIVANPNGADCERFHPDIDGSVLRRQYGFGEDVVVGLVASLQPWHGPDLIKHLLAALAPETARFLMVGRGPGWSPLRQWVENHGWASRVVFAGGLRHEDVPAHVAAMDIALVPEAGFYQSPLKVFEYMAAGRAIVAPAYEPLREVLTDGIDGLLFAPRNSAAAISAIRKLAGDATLRRRLGANARQRVTSHLTWKHNAERVIDACTAAIAASARKSKRVAVPDDSLATGARPREEA